MAASGEETGMTGRYDYWIYRPGFIDDRNTEVNEVPEAEARMVEGTYEDMKSRVLCGPGVSGEFKINIGLKQGSTLSPLLFIAVVKPISTK